MLVLQREGAPVRNVQTLLPAASLEPLAGHAWMGPSTLPVGSTGGGHEWSGGPTMVTMRPTLRSTIVLFAVFTLVLAACGGSDDADNVAVSGPAGGTADVDDAGTDPAPESGGHEEGAPVDDREPELTERHDEEGVERHDEGQGAEAASDDLVVVEIEMHEFGYAPANITVPAGEPVRLMFTNVGDIDHEVMVGSEHEQDEFAAAGGHGDQAGHHGDVQALTLAPGETGDLDVTFEESGPMFLGCHLPGHWEAGMSATVTVS